MGSFQQPLQPGTVLRFGSLEFMSRDGSYDMVLLPSQHDNTRVCPATLIAGGGGDRATVAR
jgi:hypothetical protein